MYIIKKTKTDNKIIYMEYDDPSYEIKLDPKRFRINNLYVYDKKYVPTKKETLLPFDLVFKGIANKIFNFLYSDDDDEDGSSGMLIGELDRLKALLENEYKEFLKRQEYYDYVDKISFLKDEVLNKIEINKYKQSINALISGKSR